MTVTQRQRLLIIEDDPEIQYILSVILAGEGREVVGVGSAEQARAELALGDIDLVILDLILPDADGRTLLSELRSVPATAAVPVVILTARAAPEIRQDCYALGADAFVEKPFDPEELAADVAPNRALGGIIFDRSGKYYENTTGFNVRRVAILLHPFNCSEVGRSTVTAGRMRERMSECLLCLHFGVR